MLLKSDFTSCKPGYLTEKSLNRIFGTKNASFLVGPRTRKKLLILPQSRYVRIESFDNEYVIKLNLLKGRFGPFIGSNCKIPFSGSAENAVLSYKVLFQAGFEFVKGGKLPGLGGGAGNSGGEVPTGYDGWSVRFMFKERGTICAYLYHARMKGQFGDKLFLRYNGEHVLLNTGSWNTITMSLAMNDPEKDNGIVKVKVNGIEADELDPVCFRKTADLKIDQLFFSCFMGGDDDSYSPGQDQFIMFKDFEIEY
ncbi:MAG: hypothetical protein A2Y71_14535 [Bacteroidetes bacterium RBG_13_42_15]|nr:MAG: hypothetical protein A2Y71_14535 [Bacteroidetes bacterium RBG_13_42_15]